MWMNVQCEAGFYAGRGSSACVPVCADFYDVIYSKCIAFVKCHVNYHTCVSCHGCNCKQICEYEFFCSAKVDFILQQGLVNAIRYDPIHSMFVVFRL
jgi:hypothetical protein